MRYKVCNYYDIQIISHIHTQEKKYPVCSTFEVSHVLFPPILIWHKIKTDYDKNIFLYLFHRSFITLFIRRTWITYTHKFVFIVEMEILIWLCNGGSFKFICLVLWIPIIVLIPSKNKCNKAFYPNNATYC